MKSGAHVDAIAARMSLREPQRRSLEILDRIAALVPIGRNADPQAALRAVQAEFPSIADFERDFPSLCFALATGVGKTRLMGAFIAYLHLARGVNNFFVLAPSLTIYDKLIADFTPNTAKYVFKGISEFAVSPPLIATGENYQRQIASGGRLYPAAINIFNISKINAEVRGGRAPRIRSFREEIGESYFDYLAGLPDLVLLMDESHRYRASAGIRAINELKPALGLELTATPFVETSRGPVPFANVVYRYPLARAIADGFVKEPAVVTRENFSPAGKSAELIEKIKLEDAVRLHEDVKAELMLYARETGQPRVKPFILVIARDTAHAAELLRLVGSEAFCGGRYAGKVIQVDSSVKEEETIARLLRVERADEPTEIVIHVNMLKEGWDVSNLYTIAPLRAANARTLIEQSIGRGLRLPYGRRTGVPALDRLNIVAHDRFQEIVAEASRPDSAIRLSQVVLDGSRPAPAVTVVSRPRLAAKLGLPAEGAAGGVAWLQEEASAFDAAERRVAAVAHEVMRRYETDPQRLPSASGFMLPEVQAAVAREVAERCRGLQLEAEGTPGEPDIAAIVARAAQIFVEQTIDIPRILVVPAGEVRSGFRRFELDVSRMPVEVPSDALWAAHLRTGETERIGAASAVVAGERPEDMLVDALCAHDDIAYESCADLLCDLAGQAVRRLSAAVGEQGARKVLALHGGEIAGEIRRQMQPHFWHEPETGYRVEVKRGFTALRDSAYALAAGEAAVDFRTAPADKAQIAGRLFGGFARCLYAHQKFQSDAERQLAAILERDSLKWFKPAKGQFHLYYRTAGGHLEYQPDFVAEAQATIFMLECKAANQMDDREVLAKRDVAVEWCRHATDHACGHGGKPWRYVLIPHDAVAANMTLDGLAARHGCAPSAPDKAVPMAAAPP